jgi:recombination protein RecR
VRSVKPIQRLIDNLESLPGIGPKTAQRLAYYLLRLPQDRLERFGAAMTRLKLDTKICQRCYNVDETDPCRICSDSGRDQKVICVVETPLDLLALERGGHFKGLYHVLHGVINPLAGIGPEDIFLPQLVKRLREEDIDEVIIATNPSLEGEATAMLLANRIKDLSNGHTISISRIGRGLPTGADLEYADDITLTQALEGRRQL